MIRISLNYDSYVIFLCTRGFCLMLGHRGYSIQSLTIVHFNVFGFFWDTGHPVFLRHFMNSNKVLESTFQQRRSTLFSRIYFCLYFLLETKNY